MAINIISTPNNDTNEAQVAARPLNQRWIYIASSDNFGNDGFRFVVNITSDDGTPDIDETQYIAADPAGRLNLDIYEVLRNLWQYQLNPESLHFITEPAAERHVGFVSVSIREAWIVDGILTIDEASEVSLSPMFVFDGAFDGATGPYPPITTFQTLATSGISSRILSDRKVNTHVWSMAATYGLTQSECIFIPVRQRDYGVGYFFRSLLDVTVTNVRYTIVDAGGTEHTEDIDVSDEFAHSAYPFYPANLNAGTWVTNKPSDYSGWKYYSMQLIGTDGETPCSAKYVFYPIEENCDHRNIRIGWRGHRGGWDYFNFTMKNTFERNVQRSQFQRGFSGANFNGQTRRTYERRPTVERFLQCSTDYLTKNEKALLQWLIQSEEVRIIRDNGTSIPVTVDTSTINDITTAEPQQLEQFTLRLKYAGDDLNWNGWWVDEAEAAEEPVENPLLTRFAIDFGTNTLIDFKIKLAVNTGAGSARLIGADLDEVRSVTSTFTIIGFTPNTTSSGVQSIEVLDESVDPIEIVKFGMDGSTIAGSSGFYIDVNEFRDTLTAIDLRNFPNMQVTGDIPALVDNLVILNCALTTAQVNAILTTLDANGVENGVVDISGQTTPAPPSGAGITAVTNLEAKGWIVSTD